MKKTGKRLLALVMALCLTLALGTTALADGAITLVASGSLQAGVTPGDITLTAQGGEFAESLDEQISVEPNDLGLTFGSISRTSNTTATLKLNGPPTKSGELQIKATQAAFTSGTGEVTASIHVKPASDPTVTASGTLTAGTEGTIELSITGETNTFVGSPATTLFYLVNCGGENPSKVDGSGQKVTLTVKPTNTSPITVKIDPGAFTYQPSAQLTAGGEVIPSAPTVTATATGELTLGKAEGKITVAISSDNDTFKSDLETDKFTVKVGAATLGVTSVERQDRQATLTMAAPTTKETVSVEIDKTAFTYEATANVTAGGSVTIADPTGTVSATLNGDLYAGTEVSNQTITLTAEGDLSFKAADAGSFELTNNQGGLTIASASGSGKNVTLNLGGKPTTDGDFQVKVKEAAFLYAPTEKDVTTTGQLKVNQAPEVTLELVGTVTAGDTKEINIKIANPDYVKFAAEPTQSNFTVDGQQVSGVSITDSGTDKNVTLTLSAAPSAAGSDNLTIKVLKSAFTPVAGNEPEVKVSVQAPSGPVNAALSGSPATLTAGVEAGNTTIQLSAAGSTLNFTNNPSKDYFTLENDTGEIGTLAVSGATGSGKTVTLSLTGIPKKQGTFKVKIGQGAFVASPGQDLAPGELNIDYPTVTVTPSPNFIAEDDETVTSIELKATGSVFNATDEMTNFKIGGVTGTIALTGVHAEANSDTATLAISGTASGEGTLEITIQPDAFVYKPKSDVKASITVGKPKGDLSAKLNGSDLYKGTPVTTQTITVEISNSHGLHFKEGTLANTDFELTGSKEGLEIKSVTRDSDLKATLVLSGTPSASGSFKVQAKDSAFKIAPEAVPAIATGDITVQPAPTGTVAAAPSGLLYAGTPADGTTVTLTASGLIFAAANKDNFTLESNVGGDLEITDAKLSGGKIVLTLSGTPAEAGSFLVRVQPAAFTVYPTDAVDSSSITVGAANITLALSDNTLQAGKADMTFKVTPSGGKFASDLADKITLNGGDDFKDLTLGEIKSNTDGSVTVTIEGMPPVKGQITLTFAPEAFTPAPEKAVSLTVPVAEGEQAADPVTEEGAPGINIGTPMDTLAGAVLTDEELALYEKGAEVMIELVESDIGSQVPASDKTAVEKAASGYTVGKYLDVSLYKTINGDTDSVSETSAPIRVVFTIPEDLRAADRQFAVIRVHEGKAELLKTVASSASTITVESNLFSTYAIVYREAPKTDAPGSTNAPGTVVPGTGDGTALLGWAALLLGCGAALVPAVFVLRRRDRG